jgi:glycosyltransferase involved in cell wall biosynthesis
MRIAIIVPSRDRLESVSRCLAAIARAVDVVMQRRGPSCVIHTLLVNDHSKAEFAPTLACQHPGITIVDVVGAGPGAARNTGLKHVDADLYLLTDSDCVVADDWCIRAIEWHANRCAPMGQGVPWLYQCKQNFELGKREEMLYCHMFSHYLEGGRAAMIDPRCLMLSREYFDFFPRDFFAAWIPDASAEDRSVIASLIQRGLRIDWCPDVRVFHEDPSDEETAWRQKYRHGSGRLHVWPETPDFQFLLNRYFLHPIAAGIDPGYVVPAHLAFLLGYRDSCRHHAPGTRSEWWDQFVERLFESVASAKHWLVPVELALSSIKMNGSCPAGAELRHDEGEPSRPHAQ